MRPTPSCRHSARALSGFTLIEMMTVLVLIGILTAMIIPEMKGTFEDGLLRSTGRELVDVIELASSRAVSLNQTLRVKFDAASDRYQVERHGRIGAVEDFVPLQDVAGSTGQLDKRIAIEIQPAGADSAGSPGGGEPQIGNQGGTLTFYDDGTADGMLILLRDRAGFRLTLRVSPITSRVTVLEPVHE